MKFGYAIIKIVDMTCQSCTRKIEEKLIKDVIGITVSFSDAEANVLFNHSLVTGSNIVTKIDEMGFHAVLKSCQILEIEGKILKSKLKVEPELNKILEERIKSAISKELLMTKISQQSNTIEIWYGSGNMVTDLLSSIQGAGISAKLEQSPFRCLVLTVREMTEQSCLEIENTLRKSEGICCVKAHLNLSQVNVITDERLVEIDVAEIVRNMGFPASVLSDEVTAFSSEELNKMSLIASNSQHIPGSFLLPKATMTIKGFKSLICVIKIEKYMKGLSGIHSWSVNLIEETGKFEYDPLMWNGEELRKNIESIVKNNRNNNVEMWKMKKLIKRLEAARGSGTNMISLIMKPGDQISTIEKILDNEAGMASNIASQVNSLSVLSAIKSAQEKLKLHHKVPKNGIAIYCGTIMTEEGKEEQISIDFEPPRPVTTSIYLCDSKFHTEALNSTLEDDGRFGYIIVHGSGALFGILSGNTRSILSRFPVHLPKKIHNKCYRCAIAAAADRKNKRHEYLIKVGQIAARRFITNEKVNVDSLVLGVSMELREDLDNLNPFDPRLLAKVVKKVFITYGEDNGFKEAIELSAESLIGVRYIYEKKLIKTFFTEISQDTGRFCYGIEQTMYALRNKILVAIIVWENLDLIRYDVLDKSSGDRTDLLIKPDQREAKINNDMIVLEERLFVDFISVKYLELGVALEIVTDQTPEGWQFVTAFEGIGGFLSKQIKFPDLGGSHDGDFDMSDY